MVQQTLTRNAYNYVIEQHPIDIGCQTATKHLKKQSLCIECPFEHCIKDIKYSTSLLLQNNVAIRQVYEAYSQGLTIEKVSKIFNNITLSTIKHWIKHRNRIRKLLDKYSWAIQYL